MSQKKKKPSIVIVGSRKATIYPLANGKHRIKYYNDDGVLKIGGEFQDLKKARVVAFDILSEFDKKSTLRDNITDLELDIIELIREARLSFADVMRLSENKKKTLDITVSDALERWLEESINPNGYSDSHMFKIKRLKTLFVSDYGDTRVSALSFSELEAWISEWGFGFKHHNNLLGVLKRFYRWAEPRDIVRDNPTLHIEPMPASSKAVVHEIHTPKQYSILLKNCPHDYIPWLSLGGFAGLRGVEIFGRGKDRESGLMWEDVNFETREIYVNAATAKKTQKTASGKIGRPRVVPMCDALFSWLSPWVNATGQVHRHAPPYSDSNRFKSTLTSRLGHHIGGWVNNGLRASRASYRLALLNGDVSRVKLEMGHSENMLISDYLNPRFKEDSERYFSLDREKVLGGGNVIKIA